MEVDTAILNEKEENPAPSSKKVRLFSAKEFRKQLLTQERLPALQNFVELCRSSKNADHIFEYLENGGSCLELFQLLETSTDVTPSLALEIIHYILLQIVSNYAQFQPAAYESCRYFLNTHLALINKMLTLSATSTERKVVLKLLTVIVTLSRNLAKDVLLHVSFNPTNLEVLSKQTGETESVRNVFIHFLVAFLVDGEYPTISILLEKRGLLTSIINGLLYDPSETVSMVMMALKTNILENPYVSKTAKMSIFSTPVVKDIVNLYNWKGPGGFNAKKKLQIVAVNEYDKTLVNEAVHNLLLVLCTSHKFGVIFRDRQMGLDRKVHNSLMYTVLHSLNRPWEHSYAGELVTKICGACPDLVKPIWGNLKVFLEPRATTRWLNAVTYAKVLVKELQPSSIEYCAKEFSAYQLAQIIQFSVAPTPILKTLIPENHVYEKPSIKHHVLSVLVEFLKSIRNYLSSAENWLKPQDLRTLKNLLSEHVGRNFPDAQTVLQGWTESDEELGPYSVANHLEVIFELLHSYEAVSPQLIESLNNVNLQSFLEEIGELPDKTLQIRAVKLFIGFEPSLFAPKTHLFALTLPLIFSYYFKTKDAGAKGALELLLRNSGVFEGCVGEIDLWINGIFDLESFETNTGEAIVEIVRRTSKSVFKYLSEMSKLLSDCESRVEQHNFQDILESLCSDSLQNSVDVSIKHRGLSPLLLGSFEYLIGVEEKKNFKHYFASVVVNLLHFQTFPSLITAIVTDEKYKGLVSKHVVNYVKGWGGDGTALVLAKTKAHLCQDLSQSFLGGDIDEFLEKHREDVQARPQNCLDQILFYFTNLRVEDLSEKHLNNCLKVVKFLMTVLKPQELVQKIFDNPALLHRFAPSHASQGLSTDFLINVIKQIQSVGAQNILEAHLKVFRAKLVTALRKVFKKSKKGVKVAQLFELLEAFDLDPSQRLEVLKFCSELVISDINADYLTFYYNVVVHAMKGFMKQLDNLEPLPNTIVVALKNLLTFLNKSEQLDTSSCANVFKHYLEIFPHSIKEVDAELFESILTKTEFCKENSLLAGFLLSKNSEFLKLFVQNLPNIASKKGLMLSLLNAAAFSLQSNDETLKIAYENFEPSIIKSLQKPQKAGQYFEIYNDVVGNLINKFMPEDECKRYVEKVQKFDVYEPFHIKMLTCVFTKALFNGEMVENYLNNAVLTLVHATNSLFKRKTKSDDDWIKLKEIVESTNEFIQKIMDNEAAKQCSSRTLCKNDNFQLYCKFCLKFGLSGNAGFLVLLKTLVELVDFEEGEAQLLLDMAGSHSEFLEVLLGEDGDCKMELLNLILVLCQRWPELMQRNHVPVLLAAYHATVRPSDRVILTLLQMYEKAANKTNFYDFKPFLWGTAAATHYSVRQDLQKVLWRQPKMGDILDILQEELVLKTINNYPLDLSLIATKTLNLQENVYDLSFFLPLFSLLLAPENEVPTYKFTKSGALSLTVAALSDNNEELRLAACHVLARLHYHIEARQVGKDRLLWLRFVEAICRGTAVLNDFKLNNFAAIFWARMALILTKPLEPLYVPLSQYLGAKVAPDLSAIPELYTFLHTPDVNFRETRAFILEILCDGLRTDRDFSIALHAMAFKLMLELYSSCVPDVQTKFVLLEVLGRACKLELGKKLLCSNYGLLSWLYEVIANSSVRELKVFTSALTILSCITDDLSNTKFVDCNLVSFIVTTVIDKGLIYRLHDDDLKVFLQIIVNVFNVNNTFLTVERLKIIISVSNSKKCEYLLKYGCKFAATITSCISVEDFSQLIVTKWLNK